MLQLSCQWWIRIQNLAVFWSPRTLQFRTLKTHHTSDTLYTHISPPFRRYEICDNVSDTRISNMRICLYKTTTRM